MIAKSLGAGLLVATVFTLAGVAATSAAGGPPPASMVVAASRCNSRMINEYQGEIRAYDARPPKNDPVAMNQRLTEIGGILESIGEEHNVLDSICPNETDKAPLFAQLAATTAWGLALQSDIALKLNVSCPQAEKALPAAMLGAAWLALAATVNDENGHVPPTVAEIVPKIQSRAAAVGLTLPAYAETSAYWRDQLTSQAREAVKECPTPIPPPDTPTPSPYPSPY